MKFVLGFAIGVALGLLCAPARGEETRRLLLEKARELPNLPQKKAKEIAATAKGKAGDLRATIGRQAAEAAVESETPRVVNQANKKTGS